VKYVTRENRYINGRHWGGFRVALGMTNIEAHIAAKRNKTIISMIILTAVVGLVVFAVSNIIIRKPLTRMVKELDVQSGDLTQRLTVDSRDEIGIMSGHINTFIEKVQDMVRSVVEMVEQVTATSEALSSNSEEASRAIQQVARTIEEVSKGSTEQ